MAKRFILAQSLAREDAVRTASQRTSSSVKGSKGAAVVMQPIVNLGRIKSCEWREIPSHCRTLLYRLSMLLALLHHLLHLLIELPHLLNGLLGFRRREAHIHLR